MLAGIVLATLYSVCCWASGRVCWRLIGRRDEGLADMSRLATQFVLGVAVLSVLWLLLGLLALFKVALVWAVLLATMLAGVALAHQSRELRLGAALDPFIAIARLPLVWKLLAAGALAIAILLAIVAVLSPPIGDAEAFYMVLPKIMAASERLAPQPNYYTFSQVGLVGELHYAALMAIGGQVAAKLFAWFVGAAVLLQIVALCEQAELGARALLAAIIILLSSTTFTNHTWDGKVDLFGAALGLAAYRETFRAVDSGDRSVFLLAGFFAGFACVAKFSYLLVVPIGLVCVLMLHPISSERRDVLRGGILLAAGALVATLPHLIKNAVLFHEPLAPFLFFGAKGDRWVDQAWYNAENTRHILMTYPFALSYGQYPMQGGNLSGLILAFVPVGIAAKYVLDPASRSLQIRRMAIVSVVGVATWMMLRPAVISPRYIMATLLLAVPVAAWAVEAIFRTAPRWMMVRGAAFVALGFATLFSMAQVVRRIHELRSSPLGEGCVGSELCVPLRQLDRLASQGDRVLFLGSQTYDLRPDLLQCLGSTNETKTFEHAPDAAARWGYLFDRGFKYVIVEGGSKATLGLLSPSDALSWLRVEKIHADEAAVIYELTPTDSAMRPSQRCAQTHYPAWELTGITG